jgi:methionyl-tRNA formyltransferase
MSIRTVFFGTPNFAIPTLRVLSESTDIDIVSVVTRPDKPAGRGKKLQPPPIKMFADEHGLSIYQPKSLKKDEVVEQLKQFDAEIYVVVAYGGFIPTPVREIPPFDCINLHPSLLPKYRGAAPIQAAIMNGDPKTGNTAMYLSDGWDNGDIIYQEEENIHPSDTYGTLSESLAENGARLILKTVLDVHKGIAPRIPQNDDEAIMAPMIKNDDAQIDWKKPAAQIHNLIRGINPIPGAFTICNGNRWKIFKSEIIHEPPQAPGTVMSTDFNTIRVSASDAVIEILELQPSGKKPMNAAAFLRGHPIQPGTICE